MKKSGRRLVIAPASMAYSSDSKHGKVSAESVVAFEIEVVRVCKKLPTFVCRTCWRHHEMNEILMFVHYFLTQLLNSWVF